MEPMLKLRTFIGNDVFNCSSEIDDLYSTMFNFMICVAEPDGSTGTFEIVCEDEMVFAEAVIPTWSESLFTIQYIDYFWDIMEESV